MTGIFDLEPDAVPEIETKHRRIQTKLPVSESVPILKQLREYEPESMQHQPPIIWDRAEDFYVKDPYGNKWLDFSSGVLVTNNGHSPDQICEAIVETVENKHLFSYYFPTEIRAKLVEKLASMAPDRINKVFLLSTGSETTETAMKMAKVRAQREHGSEKRWVVHFDRAYHGHTMGAQLAGGDPDAKEWVGIDDGFVSVPFPDGFRTTDRSFDTFVDTLNEKGRSPEEIAAVIVEPYQGGGASFATPEYMQSLRDWCDEHDVTLILDEVQAGFGRTGKLFGFNHYDIIPDLICCGKGISGSLPLSAVLGPSELFDQKELSSMSSTNTGHPVACAAALANLELYNDELFQTVEKNGDIFKNRLEHLQNRYPNRIGAVHGNGYVWGVHVTVPDSSDPDGDLAAAVVEKCFKKGLLMFAPVGPGSATIKIVPPLTTTSDAIKDGLTVIEDSFNDSMEEVK